MEIISYDDEMAVMRMVDNCIASRPFLASTKMFNLEKDTDFVIAADGSYVYFLNSKKTVTTGMLFTQLTEEQYAELIRVTREESEKFWYGDKYPNEK